MAAFRVLLDNYEMDTSSQEVVSEQEQQENENFLRLVAESAVMQAVHQFLVGKGRAPADVNEFKQRLYNMWFKLYRRSYQDKFDFIHHLIC